MKKVLMSLMTIGLFTAFVSCGNTTEAVIEDEMTDSTIVQENCMEVDTTFMVEESAE